MRIVMDRPLIGSSTKPIAVELENGQRARIHRWFHRNETRPSVNPRYDVNFLVKSTDTSYEFFQESFSVRRGHSWCISKDKRAIARVLSVYSAKEKYRVELHGRHLPAVSIVAAWNGSGDICYNGEKIGETKRSGFLLNPTYTIEAECPEYMDPGLCAGLAMAFWSAFHLG
ncbi:hypothetical protein [Alkalicoccus luteus]|uniref:hypothetical protein n=1 Tax=Alkalicoccus luteus TaxID=1237094 RepID=UPI004033B143